MVQFSKDSFTITVPVGCNPIEDYLGTIDELLDLLQSEHEDMQRKRYHSIELLRQMMPDIDQAKKMIPPAPKGE